MESVNIRARFAITGVLIISAIQDQDHCQMVQLAAITVNVNQEIVQEEFALHRLDHCQMAQLAAITVNVNQDIVQEEFALNRLELKKI